MSVKTQTNYVKLIWWCSTVRTKNGFGNLARSPAEHRAKCAASKILNLLRFKNKRILNLLEICPKIVKLCGSSSVIGLWLKKPVQNPANNFQIFPAWIKSVFILRLSWWYLWKSILKRLVSHKPRKIFTGFPSFFKRLFV